MDLMASFVTLITIFVAIILDAVFGEPRRWHPLVGFGHLVSWFEAKANRRAANDLQQKRAGIVGWCLLVIPLPLAVLYGESQLMTLAESSLLTMAFSAICLYVCLGWTSLRQHAKAVSEGFDRGGIEHAREQVARIVSRDTESMDEAAVARATIESVLENGSDAIFAPLFWFVLLGPAGAIAYRLANTLDAMWGYRTERFNHFGWMSAKMDDVLNYIPARLTALTYALFGQHQQAMDCWQRQASNCASPNGGPVMCSGAGALNIRLGGGAHYHGQWQARAAMGTGCEASMGDIERSVKLVDNTLLFWCVALFVIYCWAGVV